MPNPFEFISKIREMNKSLTHRLDQIIERLDELTEVTKHNAVDWYGDGR